MEKPHLRHAVLCLQTEASETSADNYLNVLDPVTADPDLCRDKASKFECLLVAALYLPDETRVYNLAVVVNTPDGDTVDLCQNNIQTVAGENYHKVICPVDFLLTGLGTYWFKVMLDGTFIGGTSLLVKARI